MQLLSTRDEPEEMPHELQQQQTQWEINEEIEEIPHEVQQPQTQWEIVQNEIEPGTIVYVVNSGEFNQQTDDQFINQLFATVTAQESTIQMQPMETGQPLVEEIVQDSNQNQVDQFVAQEGIPNNSNEPEIFHEMQPTENVSYPSLDQILENLHHLSHQMLMAGNMEAENRYYIQEQIGDQLNLIELEIARVRITIGQVEAAVRDLSAVLGAQTNVVNID